MKRILLTAVFIHSASFFFHAYAQITADSVLALSVDEVMNLPVKKRNLVTVASNVVTDARKQPVSVTTVTKEQLHLSGGRTLGEALMMFVPGFFMVEDQDDLIAGFRGMAPDNNSKVLLLIDGQNLNTEFFWGPPDAILNSINYDYIERVEVIRGPGSVTLGQGALLGVINIVTTEQGLQQGATGDVTAQYGQDGLYSLGANLHLNSDDLTGYFHVSQHEYEGQPLRNEGWAAVQGNQGFRGGTVANMGHKLRRTESTTIVGDMEHKGFQLGVVRAEQKRDLYNFYRDREVLEQVLSAVNLGYGFQLSNDIDIRLNTNYQRDDFGLYSLTGTTMGGTREERYGFKGIANINNLVEGNRLAVGAEFRRFDMGKKNRYRNNFIANVVNTFDPATANQDLTMGFGQSINVLSMFLEDFHTINDHFEVFGAVRFDNHPFWGSNFSPRIGAIISPNDQTVIRASFQSGFRGAVGLHYSGGYRNDGHLRADNYGRVDEAGIPGEGNISTIQPESMNSFELALNYKPIKEITFDVVGFYNTISNIIDVGVIYSDPTEFVMPKIGSDDPGDWNGYWYFKNSPGSFTQAGFEAQVTYSNELMTLSASHSFVKVLSANDVLKEQAIGGGSMYLAADESGDLHFKAFPENIARVNTMFHLLNGKVDLSLNALRYFKWYSPIGTEADPGLILNAGLNLKPSDKWHFSLIVKNLTNEDALYPMNSNAGGEDVSPGTPGLESTTFWMGVRYKL